MVKDIKAFMEKEFEKYLYNIFDKTHPLGLVSDISPQLRDLIRLFWKQGFMIGITTAYDEIIEISRQTALRSIDNKENKYNN